MLISYLDSMGGNWGRCHAPAPGPTNWHESRRLTCCPHTHANPPSRAYMSHNAPRRVGGSREVAHMSHNARLYASHAANRASSSNMRPVHRVARAVGRWRPQLVHTRICTPREIQIHHAFHTSPPQQCTLSLTGVASLTRAATRFI